jgi:uncharacterized membrane protein YhhN
VTIDVVWLLPLILALIEWYAVWRGDRRTQTWAKPAVLVALIFAAFALGATDDSAGIWMLVALAFGLLGDVFLLGDSDARFRLGLAAFLIGHLAYVACFVDLGTDPRDWNYFSSPPGRWRRRRTCAVDWLSRFRSRSTRW